MVVPFCRLLLALGVLNCAVGMRAAESAPPLRAPVHPRHNVEEFAPVEARYVRFAIDETAGSQPGLDELEIYGPADPQKNLALAANGARATASGTLSEYRIHALSHVNDGIYGNAHSWISDRTNGSWVMIELPQPAVIQRVVWSRDREGKFIDRLPTKYRIETALELGEWQVVASSDDRAPLTGIFDSNPSQRGFVAGYAPSGSEPAATPSASNREYVLQTWQTAQGLPSNTVTAILQTRDGWLWIGTTQGLARFDGQEFTTLGESDGLPSLNISSLGEGRDGTLWIGTNGGGLARRTKGASRIEPFRELAEKSITSLTIDARGSVWIGSAGGLYEYREGMLVHRFGESVARLACASTGEPWMLVAGTLRRWDGTQVDAQEPGNEPSRFSSLRALAMDERGSVWFGGANGYVGRLSDGVVDALGEGQPALTSVLWEMLATTDGDVWIGTATSGLVRLREGRFLPITTEDGLPVNSVRALCRDTEGNIWAGTGGGGLARLRPRAVSALTTRDGLSHPVVMALAEDDEGAIWIGTNGGGLNRWKDGRVELQSPSYVLDNATIPALATAPDSTLWLGSWHSGLCRLTAGKPTFLQLRADGLGMNITALCRTASGALWVGTFDQGPAYVWEGKASLPPALRPLVGVAVTSIIEMPAGEVWLGLESEGVARLSGGVLTRWSSSDGLPSAFVRTLHCDAQGTLWIGTSGGLSRWKNGRFENFTVEHGLPDSVVSEIIDDDKAGDLWLGTNRGVLRVPFASFDEVASGKTETLAPLALDLGDGLPSLECTGGFHPAGLRTRDGRLLFGTVAGMAIVDPAKFAKAAAPPPVFIETMTNGAEPANAPSAAEAVIQADANRVEFRFTALSFAAPQRVRFRYRMEGLESAWNDAGPARTALYHELPPGHLRFRVQASQDGGAWSKSGAEIALQVLAPWWRQPWVVAIGLLAGVTAVAGAARMISRRRLQRRLREVEHQFALERERSRIARDIHDDLGATLTQIGLLCALDDEQCQRPQLVAERLKAISTTSGELVQAVDAIVWAINPRHGTLESLARYLTRVAEDMCASAGVRLRLDVPAQLPEAPLSSELRHHLFLAAKEALHNALRHAGAETIRLRFSATERELVAVIEDDGCGFAPGSRDGNYGDGLANLHRRLAECGGVCEIVSAPQNGTRVALIIPLPARSHEKHHRSRHRRR